MFLVNTGRPRYATPLIVINREIPAIICNQIPASNDCFCVIFYSFFFFFCNYRICVIIAQNDAWYEMKADKEKLCAVSLLDQWQAPAPDPMCPWLCGIFYGLRSHLLLWTLLCAAAFPRLLHFVNCLLVVTVFHFTDGEGVCKSVMSRFIYMLM